MLLLRQKLEGLKRQPHGTFITILFVFFLMHGCKPKEAPQDQNQSLGPACWTCEVDNGDDVGIQYSHHETLA
jgi:hypothetical protein